MKKILFFLLCLKFSLLATSFNIETLNKDNHAKNILENYLNKTKLKVFNTSHLNFYIGEKKNLKILNKTFFEELNRFKNDGFIVKVEKNSIFIIGKNSRSLYYAIYQFLEKKLNYKFLSKDFEIIPKESKLKLEELAFKSEARFKYREIFIKELENTNFSKKLSLNGSFGHKAQKNNKLFINTYNYFTPFELIKEKYRDLYPEFFCSGQLDFASKDVKKYANINFQNKIKFFRKNKEDFYYIQHEDILNYCDQKQSKKLIEKYNSSTAAFLDYVNYIAKENPEKNILFEAYQWSRKAPNNFPKLENNLGIFFSNIEADFSKSILEKENKQIYEDLKSWIKYKKDIFIWNYISNFNGYLQAFPDISSTSKNIKLYSKYNLIKGVFLQGAYETNNSSLSNLKAWVYSKLLWNPELDEKKLLEEFAYYYYGEKAYKYVLKYLKSLEEEVKKTNSKLLVKTSVNSKYLNESFLKEAKNTLNSALNKVHKNSIYYKHLQELFSGIYYIELLRGSISKKEKELFRIYLKENKIEYQAEGSTIDSLKPYFKLNRKKALKPKKVSSSKNKHWIDFQEYELKLCCSKIVEDKKASSLSAVRMQGNKSDWGIQLDLTSIPKGKWSIYANIRIEKPKNLSSFDLLKPAIYYGIYQKEIKNFSLLNTLKDENYHEVKIATLTIGENETGQIWIRPPNSTNVKYIFVDRIFIIEE